MIVQYDPALLKKVKNLDVKIRNSFFEKIKIFEKNHQDAVLNNHTLKREYRGYRSINITNDYRAIYEEIKVDDDTIAYFILLGTHDQLYS